jgi:hypothetical protein
LESSRRDYDIPDDYWQFVCPHVCFELYCPHEYNHNYYTSVTYLLF